ncbi:MAG: glycosyltransferase family 2 protein [Sumerlaeia bacterium]
MPATDSAAALPKVPVSVLIPVKNEKANIKAVIQSVAFADEVVVIDSHSTDGTIEMAEEMGARVVQFDWDGKFPKKKNWAIMNVDWKHEWLLILDADEHITPAGAAEIARIVTDPDSLDGYYLNRRFMFMGGWLKHCGYYPSWNLRLFKHALGRYERLDDVGDTGSGDNEVHEHVLLRDAEGKELEAGWAKEDFLHYAYPDISVWVEKHNRYSNWEARVIEGVRKGQTAEGSLQASPFGTPLERKRWIKKMAYKLPFRPFQRFVYHYIVRKGFLDGRRGFIMCTLLGFYEFLGIAKAKELQLQGERKEAPTPEPTARAAAEALPANFKTLPEAKAAESRTNESETVAAASGATAES